MICVLLAAGPTLSHGTYLFPEDAKPKCLFHYKGEVLLERSVRVLRKCGVNDIRVVVGYKKELIEEFNNEKKLGLKLIYNPTGSSDTHGGGWKKCSDSIRLGLKGIDEDVIITVGDIYLTEKGISRLLGSKDRLTIGRAGHGRTMFKIGKEYLPKLREAEGRGCANLIYYFCMTEKGVKGFGQQDGVYKGPREMFPEHYLVLPGIKDIDWYWQTDEGIKEGVKRK